MVGMGGYFPPNIGENILSPPNLGVQKRQISGKLKIIMDFCRKMVRNRSKKLKNSDFWAAPAADCGKKGVLGHLKPSPQIPSPPNLRANENTVSIPKESQHNTQPLVRIFENP